MMDKIIVKGGQTKLQGEVEIEGAKNAVLPLLAATLLASEGEVVLTNVPILSDVFMMNNLVNHLGTAISFDQEAKKIIAKSNSEIKTTAPYEYVSKMRASIVVMGPILAATDKHVYQCQVDVPLDLDQLIYIYAVLNKWEQQSLKMLVILKLRLIN